MEEGLSKGRSGDEAGGYREVEAGRAVVLGELEKREKERLEEKARGVRDGSAGKGVKEEEKALKFLMKKVDNFLMILKLLRIKLVKALKRRLMPLQTPELKLI